MTQQDSNLGVRDISWNALKHVNTNQKLFPIPIFTSRNKPYIDIANLWLLSFKQYKLTFAIADAFEIPIIVMPLFSYNYAV